MGGKSELANQVVPTPTQEQLRIAQITQDSATFDGEKIAFQKMVRQVYNKYINPISFRKFKF